MTGPDTKETMDGREPDPAGVDAEAAVDWSVRLDRRLRTVGLSGRAPEDVNVVVVDRRGAGTTPCEPGVLSVGDHRVLVVPDRRDGAAPVEIWVADTRDRYGEVVRTLRRTVALDASVDATFESATRSRRSSAGNDVSTDGGSKPHPIGAVLPAFDTVDTALAIGGLAGAVEPLE